MTHLTLIAFGFGWMVVSALLGLYLGVRHEAHIGDLEKAAESGGLVRYHRIFEAYKWRSSVHAHGMLFSLSSVAIGLALPQSGLEPTAAVWLIGGLMAATVVWTLAALWRIRPLMGIADILFAASLATVAWIFAAQ